MALYHLSTKTIKKSKGQSALKKAKYNTRCGKYAKQEDKKFYEEHGNMPGFVGQDPLSFWKAADRHSNPRASLAREVEFALPVELNRNEQITLATRFAKHLVEDSHPYTLVLHEGKGTNPHAHLLLSAHTLDGIKRRSNLFFRRANKKDPALGGALKERSFDKKDWLKVARKSLADFTNEDLARAGLEVRVDHRSLKDQGIDRRPGEHLGPKVAAMVKRGQEPKRFDDLLQRHDAPKTLESLSHDFDEINRSIERHKRRRERSL